MDGRGSHQSAPTKSLTVIETEGGGSITSNSGDTEDSWEQQGEEDSLSFEDSFASNKYAGSFRLRFSTNASTRRGNSPKIAVDGGSTGPGSSSVQSSLYSTEDKVPGQQERLNSKKQTLKGETQELSLKFSVEGEHH